MNNGKEFQKRKYYIVFKSSSSPRWFMRYVDKYMGHVIVLRVSDDGESWLYTEATGGNIILDKFPICKLRDIYEDCVIIDCWSKYIEKPTIKIWHLNCVEQAKLILGIQKWWVITPRQLYNHIIKIRKSR